MGMGIVWEAISTGQAARRSVRKKCIALASTSAATAATRIPSTTSSAVTRKLDHSRPRSSKSDWAMAWGEGRMSGSAPPRST